ncbi:tail fiber domain-containing protein [Acinetobacter sp. S40]|uniref:tail fiber domain-containing protein n=1 Tax=Acinetobacter sp. S40 TaxID=2767434 RepID=UPI00190A09AC|nr:tail fiber domain-containing protein [Acinetobacter sp. S40]MBJ9984425.1 tail fiber domain-containing protein [Acinetobacter sp. S40]
MAKQSINLGTAPSGTDGDTNRSANTKVNANFTEIYDSLAGSAGSTTLPTPPRLASANTWAAAQTFNVMPTIKGSYAGLRLSAPDTVDASVIGNSTTLESSSGTSFYITYRDKAESNTGRINVYFPRASGTLALATSDERIKDKVSIVDEKECLERLEKLEIWNYTLKVGMSTNPDASSQPKRGFMAQQVDDIDHAYAIPPNSEGEYWGVDDRAIIADLVGAVRVLKAEIDLLKGVNNEPEQ